MITKLTLHNFQKHKFLTLDLDQLIVVLSGRSNAGKSSVLRALRWLCLNQPRGDEWAKQWGSKSVSVELEVDGHTIIRSSSQENLYTLDGREFHAFGATVPEPIAKVLNVDEVSFANQLDLHYWFHLTPGECAKELNRIVSLDRIDEVTANIASALRKAKSEAEVSETRLAEARAKRDEMAWVVEAEEEWGEVESKYTELEKLQKDRSGLHGMVEVIGEADQEAKIDSGAILDAMQAIGRAEEWSRLAKNRVGLAELVNKITEVGGEWGRISGERERVQRELDQQESCPLCGSLFDSKTAKRHTLCAK